MPSVRLSDESYRLILQQSEREDRPIVRVLRSAIEAYCTPTENDPPPGASPKRGGS